MSARIVKKETPMRFRALMLAAAVLMSGAAFVTPAAAQIEVDINANRPVLR